MENNLEVIPIFFAVDDVYSPFLAVTLQSLTENASKNYYYSIKILYTNMQEENKKKLAKYESENVKIEFVDLNYYIQKIQDKLYTRDYYTNTTYFRLFIPSLYPQYDKAIYLDGDIVVLGDISELYNINMGDNLIAAAPDDVIQNTKVFQEYAEKVVGVADYRNYFNAGVLLMNLDELRKFDFLDKFLYLLETVKFSVAQDQDYLNRLCKGRTKIISIAWDRMPMPTDKISDDEIKLIHYNLAYKPWHFDNVLYKEHFWKYAEKTEYIDEIKKIKEAYTESDRYQDMEQYKKLQALAQKECDCVGDDRSFRRTIEEDLIKKSQDRLEVLEKIKVLEQNGVFDVDVEDDPETIKLTADNVDYLKEKGKKIFLDLKFHDIPNTMQSAVRAAVRDNVWLMTIHVSDMEGMRQCAVAAKEEAEKLGIEKPIIVGVTVLTSLSNQDLQDIGCNMTTEELAIKRAKLAKEAGIDGIVCSAQEVDKIVEACGKDFVTVCPGIRPANASVGDQKRVVTPKDAINKGAHYLVVGRPITKAENPSEAAINIVKEIENA